MGPCRRLTHVSSLPETDQKCPLWKHVWRPRSAAVRSAFQGKLSSLFPCCIVLCTEAMMNHCACRPTCRSCLLWCVCVCVYVRELQCCGALLSVCGVSTGAAGRVGMCAAPSEPQPAPAACEGPAVQNHDGHPQRGATPDDKPPSHLTSGSRDHNNNCLSVLFVPLNLVPVCVYSDPRGGVRGGSPERPAN